MKSKITLAARVIMGLIFVVFGLNGFLQFIPMPPLPDAAGQFLGALAGSGYFFPVLKISEIVCGLALLSGQFVPLALTVLAPIVLNIVLFHLFLAPGGLALPIVLLIAGIYLATAYKSSFSSVLDREATPDD